MGSGQKEPEFGTEGTEDSEPQEASEAHGPHGGQRRRHGEDWCFRVAGGRIFEFGTYLALLNPGSAPDVRWRDGSYAQGDCPGISAC